MTPKTSKGLLVDPAAYSDTSEKLNALKAKLPGGAVVNLAREVLNRLANQVPEGSVDPRVVDLAQALVDPDAALSFSMIESMHAKGASIETLYLRVLAPAARHLGEMWERDEVSFADVTLGTARIYGLIRAMNTTEIVPTSIDEPHALFLSVPGETHTLGVRMAADLFRRHGWDIELLSGVDHDAVVERFIASDHWHVGISAGNDLSLAALARLILALRAERPGVRILVAGRVLTTYATEVDAMSPDAMAETFEDAFNAMTRMFRGWDDDPKS
ncbi:MAG: cobalamin-dependent protein [Pseudomonadota bacterium]